MKKKLLAVLLVGTMALSLAACGGSGDSGDGGSDSGSDTSSSDASLTVYAWDPTFNIKSMEMAGEAYAEDHEGFTLDVQEYSSDDCQQKLVSSATTNYNALADIVLMQDNSYQKFLTSYPDAFTDLSDMDIDWDQFSTIKQSYSMKDGKHYGVPFDNGAVIACYRTDILEQAGYTLEDLTDITWSRFIEIGVDVHEKTGAYLLTSENGGGDLPIMMLQSCGASFVDEDGNPNFTDNDVLDKVVDLYVEMIQKEVLLLVNNWDEYISTLNKGTVAGVVNGNWIMASIKQAEDQSGNWAITNMPKVDDVDTATNYANNGGSSWYITANCKDVELAKDFLQSTFGSDVQFYNDILPVSGAIACYLPASDGDAYQEVDEFFQGDAVYQKILEYSSNIPECPTTPYHYEFRQDLATAVQNIVDGTDKAEALKTAQETAEFEMQGSGE